MRDKFYTCGIASLATMSESIISKLDEMVRTTLLKTLDISMWRNIDEETISCLT
jgi:hypothetical protein